MKRCKIAKAQVLRSFFRSLCSKSIKRFARGSNNKTTWIIFFPPQMPNNGVLKYFYQKWWVRCDSADKLYILWERKAIKKRRTWTMRKNLLKRQSFWCNYRWTLKKVKNARRIITHYSIYEQKERESGMANGNANWPKAMLKYSNFYTYEFVWLFFFFGFLHCFIVV